MDNQTFDHLLAEIEALEAVDGVDMNALLTVSDALRSLLVWMVRQPGFQPEDLAAFLDCDPGAARQLLERMVTKTLVEEVQDTQVYHLQMASSRSARKYRVSDEVWKTFD